MPYYFICTYCNCQTPADLFGEDFGVNCTNCGEDLCKKCVETYHGEAMCEQCAQELYDDDVDNDDWSV